MPPCRIVPTDGSFASGMIAYLDCQAQAIGAQGYGALSAPGSSASLMLAALLTIFVALIGYRMLFGETPTVREGVLSLVKVGAVLALATSWPAYQTLIYDVVLRAPGELAAEIGTPAGLPGAGGGLPGRLDGVDHAFSTLAIDGVGVRPTVVNGQIEQNAPQLFAGFDTFAIGAARVFFLGGAVGAFALVRLGAGLLLALGPLFVLFLLFDATRGLFEGWLRGLIATALGALATAIVLGVELALLEPWLGSLLARRTAGFDIADTPAPLLATTIIFAGVLAALLGLMAKLAFSITAPRWTTSRAALPGRSLWPTTRTQASVTTALSSTGTSIEQRSRALLVADGIATMQRREEQQLTARSGRTGSIVASAAGAAAPGYAAPVGGIPHSPTRRTTTRVSGAAGIRDARR